MTVIDVYMFAVNKIGRIFVVIRDRIGEQEDDPEIMATQVYAVDMFAMKTSQIYGY